MGLFGQAGYFQGADGFNNQPDGPKFTFEALTGMRAWRVMSDGALVSPVYTGFSWKSGENEATHGDGRWSSWSSFPADHDPCPTHDCSAGFYAYHAEDYWYANDLSPTGYTCHHPWVSGLIAGWGRVVNGPKGFRAGKATVMALCLPIHRPTHWEELPQIRRWGTWDAWAEYATDRIKEAFPIVPVFDSVESMLARVPLQGRRPDAA
jgi:hypothetical protein